MDLSPVSMRPWCPACAEAAAAESCPRCGGEVVLLDVHPAAAGGAKAVAECLRTWRVRQSRIQRTDVFMVIPNRTLGCLAAVQPETRVSLREVPGIGPAKARDYGYVLTRYFRELHASGHSEMMVARGPMPDGLSEAEEALIADVRETRIPLHALAEARGQALDGLLADVARLVERGAPDLAQLLCSPAEIEWLAAHLDAHPEASPDDLRAAFPGASRTACILVPALLRERKA